MSTDFAADYHGPLLQQLERARRRADEAVRRNRQARCVSSSPSLLWKLMRYFSTGPTSSDVRLLRWEESNRHLGMLSLHVFALRELILSRNCKYTVHTEGPRVAQAAALSSYLGPKTLKGIVVQFQEFVKSNEFVLSALSCLSFESTCSPIATSVKASSLSTSSPRRSFARSRRARWRSSAVPLSVPRNLTFSLANVHCRCTTSTAYPTPVQLTRKRRSR